jgi:hypothetical protein
MITLNITRADDPEGVYLKIPASKAEISECFRLLDNISTTAPTKIAEAVSNVYNLSGYLKNVNIDKPGELDKIIALAQKLQTMDRESCLKFEGVLDANSVNGIDDVLRLSDSLDDYILLPDVEIGSKLGRYLVENDIVSFPESVRPHLNYSIIGTEFDAEHGGAFCRGGYVVRREELPEQFFDVRQEEAAIMTLFLRENRDETHCGNELCLLLPATESQLEMTKAKLVCEEFAEAGIVTVDYPFPYLATRVPQDCITVEDANELAQCIEQMNKVDGELLKYLSVLEVEQPETFQDALRYAMDIDDYERVSPDMEEYGRSVLLEAGDRNIDILDDIDGFMDYEAYGKYRAEMDGVVQTEFGLVRCKSEPFQVEQQGMKMV